MAVITPLLTDAVSVHDGRQLGVADTTQMPSADPERTPDPGSTARDLARGFGALA